MKTYLFGLLLLLAAASLAVFDSCDNNEDSTSAYNFGYISIINNTPYNYYISIDSTHKYYCDYIERWGKVFCDLPTGVHTVSLDGSDGCEWLVTIKRGQTEYLTCGGNK
jgi:hypothetical protein